MVRAPLETTPFHPNPGYLILPKHVVSPFPSKDKVVEVLAVQVRDFALTACCRLMTATIGRDLEDTPRPPDQQRKPSAYRRATSLITS